MRYVIEARDTITCAPELVRLTLNMAMAHTDRALSYLGARLVYGGHHLDDVRAGSRALPNLVDWSWRLDILRPHGAGRAGATGSAPR
jgi:hypothetical protein